MSKLTFAALIFSAVAILPVAKLVADTTHTLHTCEQDCRNSREGLRAISADGLSAYDAKSLIADACRWREGSLQGIAQCRTHAITIDPTMDEDCRTATSPGHCGVAVYCAYEDASGYANTISQGYYRADSYTQAAEQTLARMENRYQGYANHRCMISQYYTE